MEKVILTPEQYESLPSISGTARILLSQAETQCLAIKEGEDILAYGVLSEPGYGEKKILNHIGLKYRDDAESLMALYVYIKEYCSSLNITRLICRYIDDIDGVNYIHRLMTFLPGTPLMLNGHRIIYNMNGTDIEKVIKAHSAIIKLLPFVKNSADVKGHSYNKFYEQLRKIGRAPHTIMKDDINDRYFEYRSEIVGFMNALRVGEDYMVMADSYVTSKEVRSYAFPAMLTSLLKAIDEDFKNTGKLVIQIYEEPVYRGTISMLGKPDSEDMIFEYVLTF